MEPSTILRIIIIATGVFMMGMTISSLAKRRMNESFCLAWGLISVAVIIAGIILRPSEWNTYISVKGLILVLIIFFVALYAAYFISLKVSELLRKNQELAIQVSLLNQENERILKRLSDELHVDVREL